MIKEKFTAIIGQDQDENGTRVTELVIRRSVWAGIDGPIFNREIMKKEDPDAMPEFELDAVDEILKAQGFERSEGWKIHQTYSGMSLEAELIEV